MISLEPLRADLRLAVRILAKSPAVTALSVVSIALGIGLTAGMFSVGDAMLLRPMPFHEPRKLLQAFSIGDDRQVFLYGWPDYLDIEAAAGGIAEFAAYQRRGSMLRVGDEMVQTLTNPITPNFFSLVGVKAMLGQASVDPVAGQNRVVLGYHLWERRFGGERNIVGMTIVLRNKPFLVAGVLPKEFTGLVRGVSADVWMNNDAWFATGNREEQGDREGQYEIIARLKPGVSPQRAAAQLDAAIRGAGKHKAAPAGITGSVLESHFAPNWAATLTLGGGLVLALSLVLFVACANVAQLRLAQSESRKKELGVRMALGAGSWRVARQLLVETGLLTAVGAGVGLMLAQLLMEKAALFLSAGRAFIDFGIKLDSRVLAFTLLAVLLSVLFSGLAPVRHAVKLNVSEILKAGQGATGAGKSWQKKFFVVGQVAVSVALFGAAAMFLASLRNASAIRPGLDPQKKLLVMTVGPGLRIDAATWCTQACERLAAIGGVRGATFARRLPLSGSGGGWTARIEIPGQAPISVPENDVGGTYFATMGTRVVAGRGIDSHDRPGTPLVAVVSQAFARQLFPGSNPLGNWVKIAGQNRQIVGVAEDGPSNDLHEPAPPFVYMPYGQAPQAGDITLMIETAGRPEALARAIREELKRFDPRVTVYSTQTLQQQMDEALAQDRMMASTAGGLGIFGVLLTAAGLFGLLQYMVNRRTREMGLRMALGARPAELQRLVLSESLRLAAWGIPIGLFLLAGAGWFVRSRLVGITPLNPLVYLISAVAVLALTLISAWIPALRATRVDPMAALRSE
jgi:predicted permease